MICCGGDFKAGLAIHHTVEEIYRTASDDIDSERRAFKETT